MSTLAGQYAVVQYDDLFCVYDSVYSLCHYDDGAVAHLFFEGSSQCLISLEVKSRKAVIKYEYIRLLYQC